MDRPDDGSQAGGASAGRPLLDRVDERRVLDRMIADATSGVGRACVVHGEAGMGKTRLLEHVVETATHMRSVWVAGAAAERDLGYAGLHRLLGPFLADMDSLPAPQLSALGSAFGLHESAPADVFLVGLGCLTLLTNAATAAPLLCVVDDAQWIDEETLAVLAFVGRRLSADRVALFFGLRDGNDSLQQLAGLATVPIGGLPDDAAMELLSTQVDVELDSALARRIIDSTSGCPLALLELTSDLSDDQLRGDRIVSEPLPIGRQLENHFIRQVRALSDPAQIFLLIAAAETSGDADLVRRVTADLQVGSVVEAEDVAVASGLLTTGTTIKFRHPLIRSAVYAGAARPERRRVHTSLAAAIDPETDPDRRAQHLAAAAPGPDEHVAATLEQAAQRARRRGGYAAEASFLVHAAQLTPAADRRAERRLSAASAALSAGQPFRAQALLEQAQPALDDPLQRAEAMRLGGRLAVPLGQCLTGPPLLFEAAQAFEPLDPPRVREVLLETIDACLVTLQLTVGTTLEAVAELALSTSRATPESPTLHDLLLEGMAHMFVPRYQVAMPLLRGVTAQLVSGSAGRDEVAFLFTLGLAVVNELWDDESYGKWARIVEEHGRAHGALYELQVALLSLGKHEIRRGRFAAAREHLEEVSELARSVGIPAEYISWQDVDLLAWQGSTEAVGKARELIEGATSMGSGVTVALAQLALGTLALGEGRYADALAEIRPLVDVHQPGWTCQALMIAVEAAARTGDTETAASCLEQLDERASAAGTPWGLGQLARGRALTTDGSGAEQYFLEAIALLQRTSVRTELAQTHLGYGEWLRRQQRNLDARAELNIAHDMFSEMGAQAFARRAAGALAATGEHVRRGAVETTLDLTPQEGQIARLAATGATNPEIGERLFISASTVDYHLRKVFRKLGITSRRQLAGYPTIEEGARLE